MPTLLLSHSCFLYSTVNIPYTALRGVISDDPVDRTSAASFKFVVLILPGLLYLPLHFHLLNILATEIKVKDGS